MSVRGCTSLVGITQINNAEWSLHVYTMFVNHMIKREGSFPAKEVVNLVLARRIEIIITNASPKRIRSGAEAKSVWRPN